MTFLPMWLLARRPARIPCGTLLAKDRDAPERYAKARGKAFHFKAPSRSLNAAVRGRHCSLES